MRKLSLIVATVATVTLAAAWGAYATVDSTCPGNVCSHVLTISGQAVQYQWNQNVNGTDGSLKVRFQSGPYGTGAGQVRFKISVNKPFATYSTLKNPDPTVTLPPTQAVDVTNLWIERSMNPVPAGTKFDFTQELRYESPTPGTINLTIEVAQYGVAQTITPLIEPLQAVNLDLTAPTNRDEGADLPEPPYILGYKQCADGVDNDLDYRLDCADSNCLGKTIRTTPLSVCEAVEMTCNDGLDNDGNGKTDCADPVCNGRPGNAAGDKFCGAENGGLNHINCADGFDNDGNGKIDCHDDTAGTGCFQTGYQDCAISETIPSAADVGKTPDQLCTDNIDNDRNGLIDAADPACSCTLHPTPDDTPAVCSIKRHIPVSERQRWDAGSGAFVDAPGQCVDGKDNDLDGLKDCADPDCLSYAGCARHEAWLPPSPLGDGSAASNPASYFNYCNDGLDNDGNGLVDAADPACKNRFGECDPGGIPGLSATENISFSSCADGVDNDLNGTIDCADATCRTNGKVGRLGCANGTCGGFVDYAHTDAAVCAATENQPQYCGDGFDNNGNGLIDCADSGCLGIRHGPIIFPGYICGTENGAACSDGYDNDGNGNTDCFDANCQNGVQCAQRNWGLAASCTVVPDTTALTPIVLGGTVRYAHDDRLHVNDPYRVRFTGSGSYSSLTLVVGDALNPANAFPFNATTCVLTGTGATSMRYTASDARVGMISLKSGSSLPTGFDITLTCTSSASVIGPPAQAYSLDIVANNSGVIEYGETYPSVQVYEATPPVLSPTAPAPTPGPAIDVEGIVTGVVNVPAGATVRFQAKPGDPAPSSGICRCDFNLGGVGASSADGNCLASRTFANSAPALSISASALDGASNRSATSTPQTVNINVVPSVASNLALYNSITSHPSYSSGETVGFSVAFQADTLKTFPGPCHLYVYDGSWGGAEASTVAWTPAGVGTPLLTCAGVYTVPGPLSGGRYNLVVQATDSSGNVARSNIQTILKCDLADVGTGDCKDADLDHDGVPDGRYTPNGFSGAPSYKADGSNVSCDNCLNFANADQRDSNANGIGDACEASAIGRCSYKYCGATSISPPGAPCVDDSGCTGSDRCLVVEQTMCTVNCVTDTDCSPPTAPITGGKCILDWGICKGATQDGQCCFSNDDCDSGTCDSLVKPFVQALSGQVYAVGGIIQGRDTPPVANATFCVTSGGVITNFTSAAGCSLPNTQGEEAPKAANGYQGTFGILDVNGILGGKYGPVINGGIIPNPLGGRIILYDPGTAVGLTVASPTTFLNGAAAERGNGLIVVKGDLHISADVGYENMSVSDLKRLASVGWIVLPNSTCVGTSGPGCGNVTIDPAVGNFVGAVFASGTIDTGSGSSQLNIAGALIAKDFHFGREFASRTQGAERITFDPRLLMNPPPGMTDVSRSLPGFTAVPAQ